MLIQVVTMNRLDNHQDKETNIGRKLKIPIIQSIDRQMSSKKIISKEESETKRTKYVYSSESKRTLFAFQTF